MKNKANKELDELVIKYKKDRTNENFKPIFEKLKGYIKSKTYNDETLSDGYWILNKAVETWKPETNIYFFYYFDLIFKRFRKEMYQIEKNFYKKCDIWIDQQNDNNTTVGETIPDLKWEDSWKRLHNKYQFYTFVEKIDDPMDRKILKIIYEDPSIFQSEIAKKIGVSQVMIHKRIKKMKLKPYANELKEILRDNI